jgi:hypothetical protein
MAEDQLFIIDLNMFEKSISYSKQIFYTYFKHSTGQLTSQQNAICELSETIPVVAGKIRSKTDSNHAYFEVILARQIATLVKNSNRTSIQGNVMRNIALIGKLNKRSQLRIFLELIKIPILKLKKRSNE